MNTQTTVHEPNPKLIVEHPPQGMFPLSVLYQYALYVQKKNDSGSLSMSRIYDMCMWYYRPSSNYRRSTVVYHSVQ